MWLVRCRFAHNNEWAEPLVPCTVSLGECRSRRLDVSRSASTPSFRLPVTVRVPESCHGVRVTDGGSWTLCPYGRAGGTPGGRVRELGYRERAGRGREQHHPSAHDRPHDRRQPLLAGRPALQQQHQRYRIQTYNSIIWFLREWTWWIHITKHSHARLGVIDSAHLKRILCLTSPKLHKELQTPNISDIFKDIRLRIKPDTSIWLRGLFCVLFFNRGLDMFKISRCCCTVVNSPSYGKSIAILDVQ